MDTASRNHGIVEQNMSQAGSITPSNTSQNSIYTPFTVKNRLTSFLPALVIASSLASPVTTGFITDFDRLPKQLQRDQLSSSREARPRQAQRISLRDARQMALRILAETEKNLREERLAEARFLASFWETDAQDI